MFYEWMDSLIDEAGRVAPECGRGVRFIEKQYIVSHVLLDGIDGFAFSYDENFMCKKVFKKDTWRGFCQRCDYIVLHHNVDGGLDVFCIEMKANCSGYCHVIKQLQSGIAFLAYCKRLGIDRSAESGLCANTRFYASVLTQTDDLPMVTNPQTIRDAVQKRVEEAGRLYGHKGVICVEDHKLTVDQLRAGSQEVFLESSKCNTFPDLQSL